MAAFGRKTSELPALSAIEDGDLFDVSENLGTGSFESKSVALSDLRTSILSGTALDDSILDHGELSGLLDDDHPQYLLADGSRLVSGDLRPSVADTHSLGTSALRWKDLFISSGSVFFNDKKLALSGADRLGFDDLETIAYLSDIDGLSGRILDTDVSQLDAADDNCILIYDDTGIGPDQVSGLRLWLRADNIVGLSDGDPISAWRDESGFGNDFFQTISGERPTFEENEANGRPTTRYDGINDTLSGGTPISLDFMQTSDFTIVAAVRPNTTIPTPLVDVAGRGNNDITGRERFALSLTSNRFGALDLNRVNVINVSVIGTVAVSDTIPSILVGRRDFGSTLKIRTNGGDEQTTTDTFGAMSLGARPNLIGGGKLTVGPPVGPDFFPGDIYEVLIYNRALPTSEIQQLESYLATKYNIPGPSQGSGTFTCSNISLDEFQNDIIELSGILSGGIVLDHGELSGLLDDDHPQYLLADGSRLVSGDLRPSVADTHSLGTSALRWKDLFISSGSVFLDNKKLALSGATRLGFEDSETIAYLSDIDGLSGRILDTDASQLDASDDNCIIIYDDTGLAPDQVSGLKLWLKADGIANVSDGDPVTAWLDESQNGHDFTQNATLSAPIFKENVLNNRPGLRFDGTVVHLSGGEPAGLDFMLTQDFTIFYVSRHDGSPAINIADNAIEHVYSRGDGIGGDNKFYLVGKSDLIPPQTNFTIRGTGGTSFVDQGFSNTSADIVTSIRDKGVQLKQFVNGENLVTAADGAGDITFTTPHEHIIGAFFDPTNFPDRSYAGFFSGDIFELIVYDSALADQDRQNVESYLATKYNLPGPTKGSGSFTCSNINLDDIQNDISQLSGVLSAGIDASENIIVDVISGGSGLVKFEKTLTFEGGVLTSVSPSASSIV